MFVISQKTATSFPITSLGRLKTFGELFWFDLFKVLWEEWWEFRNSLNDGWGVCRMVCSTVEAQKAEVGVERTDSRPHLKGMEMTDWGVGNSI